MKQCVQIICGVTLGCFLAVILLDYIMPASPPTELTPASVTVDASDSLTYRPVRALGDDLYLVEITYPHSCKNPFPFGNTMMIMVVPHLVRMHASELEELSKTGSLLVITSELDNSKK